MWWFRPSFNKRFRRIAGGYSSSQVRQLLGEPAEVEDTAVPLGSTWGNQPALTYKIRPGEPVKQWMFKNKDWFHYIWFAKVERDDPDPWRVTLKNRVSHKL
jgi:hypothetical protein